MDRVMRGIHSYTNSHLYEIHAVIAATITLIILYVIKRNVKYRIDQYVERRAIENVDWQENKELYRRRCNMLLIVLAFGISFVVFCIVSLISPLISFSVFTGFLSGTFCLTEYAVIDQLCIGKGRRSRDER